MSLLAMPFGRKALLAAPLAAAALLTACSSSASSSGGNSSAPAGGGSAAKPPAAGATVTVQTHTGPLGTYLTDSAGRTLYLWMGDKGSASSCAGQCPTYWPALTVKAGGTAKATGSAQQAKIATIARSDGSKQVTYNGHPLYYFALDAATGTTKGQGDDDFGAKWWVVSPAGTADTKTAPGAKDGDDDKSSSSSY